MADEYLKEGFKELLKQYFFNTKKVKDEYPTLDPEVLGPFNKEDRDRFKERSDAAKAAREYAFERFFVRIQNEPILDANGNPYPMDKNGKVDLEKVVYDFFLGQSVIFKGMDPDGMVKVQTAENNAYRQALVNSKGKITIDPDKGNLHLHVESTNYNLADSLDPKEYSEDVRRNPNTVTKPKRLGWWNKIVKAFTGHSCKAWKDYDKAQQIIVSEKAVAVAQNHAQINDVLNEKSVNNDYRRARIDKMKKEAEEKGKSFFEDPKQAPDKEDLNWRRDITQTIMDSFEINPKTGKFELKSNLQKKIDREKRDAEKQKAEEALKAQKAEKKEEPKEVKEEPKPEVPKEPEKPLKEDPHKQDRIDGGMFFRKRVLGEDRFAKFDPKKLVLYQDNKGNHRDMVDKIKEAYERIEAFADPNKESDMTKEQLANDLATVYLGTQMFKNLEDRKICEDGDEKTLGDDYTTALEGIQGKHGLHKDLVNIYLKNPILDDAMKHPEHLNDYVLNGEASLDKLTDMTNQLMGKKVVESKSKELLDAQLKKEGFDVRVEEQQKALKVEKPEVAKVEQPTVRSI